MRPSRWALLLGAVGATVLVLLVYFDLGPPLAFGDDWGMSWEARQLIAHHVLRIIPEQSAFAIFQAAWAWLLTLGHPDQRLLRLTAIPFVAIGAISTYRLALDLGADRFWGGVAALSLATVPTYLGIATSFHTEAFYIGALMAAAHAGVRWLRGQGHTGALIGWSAIATLERQHGLVIVVALTLAILVTRLRLGSRAWVTIGILWLTLVAIEAGPFLLGVTTPVESARLSEFFNPTAGGVVPVIIYLPAMVGLVLLPFLVVLAKRPALSATALLPALVPTILAFLGLTFAGVCGVHNCSIFAGTSNSRGLYPYGLPGFKTQLYPTWAFWSLQLLVVAMEIVVFFLRRADWARAVVKTEGAFLVLLACGHLVPMIQTGAYDRYYFPVAAPLVPLVAAWAATGGAKTTLARAWPIAAMGIGLLAYVVGETDYQAWQQARDVAAKMVYRMLPPIEVNAGYEANAVYVEIPLYERTGHESAPLRRTAHGVLLPSLEGPPNAKQFLWFAAADDPRPGVVYNSLAPGKIVVAPYTP